MLSLSSPAKINLFLKIVGRRPDGYHDLASLFQTVSLTDTIHFALHDRDQLTCSDPTLPIDETNLILKAAVLFRRKTGLTFGLKAHLEKNIPYQSGLGGGSGNAATTLWALNKLCKQSVEDATLAQWASEIGSDISFFFSHGTAYCTGRGEIVNQITPLPQTDLWIVKPPFGLSTPEVYKKLDLNRLQPRDPKKALDNILNGIPDYFNDLEEPAFLVKPELPEIKQQLLLSGFQHVVMTGSGSGFFCLGDHSTSLFPNFFCQSVQFVYRQSGSWY